MRTRPSTTKVGRMSASLYANHHHAWFASTSSVVLLFRTKSWARRTITIEVVSALRNAWSKSRCIDAIESARRLRQTSRLGFIWSARLSAVLASNGSSEIFERHDEHVVCDLDQCVMQSLSETWMYINSRRALEWWCVSWEVFSWLKSLDKWKIPCPSGRAVLDRWL